MFSLDGPQPRSRICNRAKSIGRSEVANHILFGARPFMQWVQSRAQKEAMVKTTLEVCKREIWGGVKGRTAIGRPPLLDFIRG